MIRKNILLGVSLISAASLMLELCCTRLFSVTLFYHFAFLVVSLALFGIGVAGIVLYLRQRVLSPERLQRTLAFHALGFGLSVIVALFTILRVQAPPAFGWEALLRLSLLYLIAALPFFFSGMCLSLVVTVYKEHISRVYFYDLIGAAIGCLLTIPVLNLLGGPSAVLLVGALGGVAAICFQQKGSWRLLLTWALAAGLCCLAGGDAIWHLFRVPSVKAVDENQVIFSSWNSFSRVTVSRTPEDHLWMNLDSDAATRIFDGSAYLNGSKAQRRFSETRVASLVYAIRNQGHALIIGPGGGADVVSALMAGVQKVTGVELNGIIVHQIMGDRFAAYSGNLYQRPEVEVSVGEGRSFVRRSEELYDSIQATLVDTWAATNAGAFTLSENNIYTREAFVDFITHLKPDGILTMTRWRRVPPREFERLVSLGVSALSELGVQDRSRHFFVAADDRMASLLLKRTPFGDQELQTLRATCRADGLQVVYDPDQPKAKADLVSNLVRSPDPAQIWNSQPLDLSPPTDNRPFFFFTIKPRDFFGQLFGGAGDKNDIGVQVLLGLLLLVTGLVGLFFLLPLLLFRRRELRGARGRRALQLLFFVAIGFGFIGLEIAWMQHFILFLGHPIFATGVVLFLLLLSSGIGSYLTHKIPAQRAVRRLVVNVGMLAVLVALYAVVLGPIFRGLMGWPLVLRMIASGIMIALPGLLMGSMMPLAIKTLSPNSAFIIPWAWGINGAASVMGSVAAVALSMNLGYSVTLMAAALVYVVGGISFFFGSRGEQTPPSNTAVL